jgi:hypothetical protein
MMKLENYDLKNKIMQNKPNFQNTENVITSVITMTNNNEQRTTNYAKQTQSNPISDSVERFNCKWPGRYHALFNVFYSKSNEIWVFWSITLYSYVVKTDIIGF